MFILFALQNNAPSMRTVFDALSLMEGAIAILFFWVQRISGPQP